MKHAPDFKTHEEHDKWVIENAEYFTAIVSSFRRRIRAEADTLDEVRHFAKKYHEKDSTPHILIYAVCGVYSAYVETLSKGEIK